MLGVTGLLRQAVGYARYIARLIFNEFRRVYGYGHSSPVPECPNEDGLIIGVLKDKIRASPANRSVSTRQHVRDVPAVRVALHNLQTCTVNRIIQSRRNLTDSAPTPSDNSPLTITPARL